MTAITLTCRTCGDTYLLPEGVQLRECPSCGTVNCRPVAEGDTLQLLRRATQQRVRCDFHNAVNSYQHVLLDCPDEHEALWGLVLCRYGVEYVDDPVTGKRMPVVHSVRKKPMQLDSDFRQACELAPEEISAQYEAEAEYIDDAMRRICEIADSCPPYDVFICHKTTRPGSEEYTEDYTRAFKLYHMLDKQGYRVFFAPMEMEGVVAGSDYEAAIYHALDTSRVMLVVCSNADYLVSPWVRSEYLRFLEMADAGEGKCLLPLIYGGLSPMKLPRDFRARKLQAIEMGEMGSAEKVSATVSKYAGKKQAEVQAKVEPVKSVSAPAPVQQHQEPPTRPVQPVPTAVPYAPESHFTTKAAAGGVAITGYTGPGGEVRIPASIAGRQVVEIGEEAFAEKEKLTKVVIPEGVRRIGSAAFDGCTGLRSVAIPASVSSMEDDPFNGCSALQGFTVAADNDWYHVQDNVLFSREDVLVRCPAGLAAASYSVPEGVAAIGAYAFDGCTGLTSVTLPDSVESIGNWAFAGCDRLSSINLPDNVTSIGSWAFDCCESLSSITIPAKVSSMGRDVFSCATPTLRVHPHTTAHRYAEENNLRFDLIAPPRNPEWHFMTTAAEGGVAITGYTGPGGEVMIPATIGGQRVVEIGERAFEKLERLRKVDIPGGVTRIADWAFTACSGLNSVVIPDSVRSIGNFAFQFCTGLTAVTIPDGVESIGIWAFYGCSGLRSVTIPASVSSIRESAFDGCTSLTLRVIPNTIAQRYAQENNNRFEVIGLVYAPEKHFETEAAEGGVCITRYTGPGGEVLIPATIRGRKVVQIGEQAFENQTALTKVVIPEGVTGIGYSAFGGCTSLGSVALPDSLSSIGSWVFKGCTGLGSITIPSGVTGIMYGAFQGCTGLSSVVIPDGVKSIGDYTFEGCASLKSVTIPSKLTSIGHRVFYGCASLDSVTIPDSVKSIGKSAFAGCAGMRSITIPKSVLDIENDAFEGCTGLTFRVYPVCPAHRYALKFHFPLELLASMPKASTARPAASAKPAPVAVNYAPESHFTATPCAGGVRITRYTGPGGEVNIPPTIGGQNVVTLGESTFVNCPGVFVVTFPDTLRTIEGSAFCNCSGLKRVMIPRSVERITWSPFVACTAMESIMVENSNAGFYTQGGMLFSRQGTLLTCPVMLEGTICSIPEGTKRIGMHAFNSCYRLTNVHIPEGVTEIGIYAFSGCRNLQSLRIPASVISIPGNPVTWCSSLTGLSVAPENQNLCMQDGLLFTRDMQTLICCPIMACGTEYQVPAATKVIAERAFAGCSTLRRISIPASVRRMGDNVFKGCDNVVVCAPENSDAHAYAQKNGLRYERPAAAAPAPAPASTPVPAASETDFTTRLINGGYVITKYNGRASVVDVPAQIGGRPVIAIGPEAFRTNTMLDEVIIPHGVTGIGNAAFRECTNLQRVSLPETVRSIGENAFQGCRSLKAIRLPQGLTQISSRAFNSCQALQEVVIPDGVVSLGESAFDYCVNLRSVTLPAGLQTIGATAFYRCYELSKINLPEGVKLGKDVFGQCKKLPNAITKKSSTGFVGFFDKILPF